MTRPFLFNLAAYSAQVACLVAVGALAASLLRLSLPSLRYAYWRGLLVVSLGLPWLQGRASAPIGTSSSTVDTVAVLQGPASPATAPTTAFSTHPAWPRVVVTLLIGGALLRLCWIAAGLWRLRRLRRQGAVVALSGHDALLRSVFAREATVRAVPGLQQPVTFGWRQPVVLIPASLTEDEGTVREAVLCHEFLHVDRRDWLSVLLEQVVTSVFWFHPAIWWLVGRVQLSREEVVDDLAVRAIGARRSYIEALLLFADRAAVVPAAAFARRRHLFHRIQLVAKERVMSVTRIGISSALLAVITASTVWYASQAFPLWAAPQQITTSPGPVERAARSAGAGQVPRLLSSVNANYPQEAAAIKATGAVTVKLTVDQSGNVAEVRPTGFAIGGPGLTYRAASQDPLPQTDILFSNADPMRDAGISFLLSATDAVRQWVFEPPVSGPVSFYAVMLMTPGMPAGPNRPQLISATNPPLPQVDPSPLARSGGAGIGAFGVAGPVSQPTTSPAGRRGGQAGPSAATLAAATPTPTFVQGQPTSVPPLPPPPPPPPPPPGVHASITFERPPIRIGGAISAPKKIKDVKPVYPAIAQSARVQGIVIVELTIDPTGHVVDAKVLRSIPLLDEAAIKAVMQWEFTPTLLNGEPTAIIMSATVNFQLAPPPDQPPQP